MTENKSLTEKPTDIWQQELESKWQTQKNYTKELIKEAEQRGRKNAIKEDTKKLDKILKLIPEEAKNWKGIILKLWFFGVQKGDEKYLNKKVLKELSK